jgi:PAS domain S-box-containing protein
MSDRRIDLTLGRLPDGPSNGGPDDHGLSPRGEVIEAVAHAAEVLAGAPSWEDVIDEVLGCLGQAAGAGRTHLFLNQVTEAGGRTAVLRAGWTAPGLPAGPLAAHLPHAFLPGFDRWADLLARGAAVHGRVEDLPGNERRALEEQGLRAVAMIPVFAGPHWWGTLGFDDFDDRGEWSRGDLDALRVVAGVLGATAGRHRQGRALGESEERARAQGEYLEAFHQTALGLIRRLDLDDLLHAVVSRAGALVGTEHGWVYVVNQLDDAIEVKVGLGLFSSWVGFTLSRGEGVGGKVWERGETLRVDDYDTWEGRSPNWPAGVFHAAMGVPLTSGDRVVGVVGLVHVEAGRTFGDDDVAVLSRFAELASLALDNARLYTSARSELAERRRAEEALRFQAHLLDVVENAVVATDEGDRITYWNAFAERLFGHAMDEAIGKRFREVIPISDHVAARVDEEAVRGRTWSGDLDVRRPDGSTFVVSARVSPIHGSGDPTAGLIGVFMDVTERHRAEEALRAAFEREKDVSSRLLALDEMKNTFLEAVSHELRTPLASILGLALTMERQRELPPDRSREMLERLAVNARKLDRLLSDLLDLDRLSRGIVGPRRRPTDIRELVEQVVGGLELADNRPVEIDVDGLSVVGNVDGAKVERIVENLVANAARHTPDGLPIWVRVRREPGGVLIAVEDSGPGVPEHLREAVFEPFQQGPRTRTYSPGVGIGLSLVARFAELHGGRAWTEDRPGGGASFRVWLPDRNPEAAPR